MGRPREFDEDQVVHRAVAMFAQRSYDGTSIDDLVNHLGVHRGSLYKTFGNKRGLYLTALRRHIDHDVTALATAVAAGADADEVRQVLADGHDLGLLFLAMVERAPIDPEAAAETNRAMTMLDEANGAQRRTALALGLLLRARAAAGSASAAPASAGPLASIAPPRVETAALPVG
jgi:TetR/AcrR family transcriptional regulator, transcriptional repressor for nem operon